MHQEHLVKVNGVNFDFKSSLKECTWHNEYDNTVARVAKEYEKTCEREKERLM